MRGDEISIPLAMYRSAPSPNIRSLTLSREWWGSVKRKIWSQMVEDGHWSVGSTWTGGMVPK